MSASRTTASRRCPGLERLVAYASKAAPELYGSVRTIKGRTYVFGGDQSIFVGASEDDCHDVLLGMLAGGYLLPPGPVEHRLDESRPLREPARTGLSDAFAYHAPADLSAPALAAALGAHGVEAEGSVVRHGGGEISAGPDEASCRHFLLGMFAGRRICTTMAALVADGRVLDLD